MKNPSTVTIELAQTCGMCPLTNLGIAKMLFDIGREFLDDHHYTTGMEVTRRDLGIVASVIIKRGSRG